MARQSQRDQIHVRFEPQGERIYVVVTGSDRPSLIASYAGMIDTSGLYIESMAYHLEAHVIGISVENPFRFEFVAKGPIENLENLRDKLESSDFGRNKEFESVSGPHNWHSGHSLVFSLSVPDRPGITSELAEIAARLRNSGSPQRGNILNCLGLTQNSSGPQGGVPHYHIQAQIQANSIKIRDAIASDLNNHFGEEASSEDLKITFLK